MAARPVDTRAQIEELVALYRQTRYDICLPNNTNVSIRIGELVVEPIRRWIGHDRDAFYLSACNPFSRALTAAENATRSRQLRAALLKADARFLEGEAGIAGQPWREESLLAADIACRAAIQLARLFEQNAIVRISREGVAELKILRDDWLVALRGRGN